MPPPAVSPPSPAARSADAEALSTAPPAIEMEPRPASPASTCTLASASNAPSHCKGASSKKEKELESEQAKDIKSTGSHVERTPPTRPRQRTSLSCFGIRDRLSAIIHRRRNDPVAPPAVSLGPVPATATVTQTAEMRRLTADIQGIVNGTSPNIGADIRILQLQYDALVANATTKPRSTANLFKEACSTDLLFLIDTTGSMVAYIEAAKSQVRSLVDEIKSSFFNDADVRIAVVSYKDHCDRDQIQSLDFTTSADRVHAFLDELTAYGGGDAPEDVLGGIQRALNLSWRQRNRCMIHICDAPSHGRNLHDMGDPHDRYPSPGSEPHRLTHGPLLAQMMGLGINYAMLRINNTTDRMAFNFLRAYVNAAPECKLHTENRYYNKGCELSEEARKKPAPRRRRGHALQFEEHQLGTTYSALEHLVVKSVTSSASRTASRLSGSTVRDSFDSDDRPAKSKRLGFGLKAIKEDDARIFEEEEEEEFVDADLEVVAPKWDARGWLDKTLVTEAYSTDVAFDASLDDMMASDSAIRITATELTIHKRSRPFAQGAMRVAAYARTAASKSPLVVKSFKRDGKQLAHLADDMRIQVLCKAFALEFNALMPPQPAPLDFVVATCLKPKVGGGTDKCMSLEPYISGNYVKHNSNSGFVSDENANSPVSLAAQAFSHFTFERSQGKFLVCDVQGVGSTMTDPAVHTADPERFKLVDTNLGEAGFKFFFATHKCNEFCVQLGLLSNAAGLTGKKQSFRTNWTTKGKGAEMMHCANKMCRRILRAMEAKGTEEGEWKGLHWCESCWQQLEGSKKTVTCGEGEAAHDFEVFAFFAEVQGIGIPHLCAKHR